MIELIVAVSDNGVIGRSNALPWSIPEDLARFRRLTMGSVLIMGRRTFESLPVRPLPGRDHIVLTSDNERDRVERVVFTGPSELELDPERLHFVIGGPSVFDLYLRDAARLHVTHVRKHVEGDTFWDPLAKAREMGLELEVESSSSFYSSTEDCMVDFVSYAVVTVVGVGPN